MIRSNLPVQDLENTLSSALNQGFIRQQDAAVIFYDLDFLEERLAYLLKSFPAGTLHGIAIKANPLMRILEKINAFDPALGTEAASVGEVMLALEAGFAPERIVYDSPVKTHDDLRFAIRTGVHLNMDNPGEVARAAAMDPGGSHATFGLRINPQVGTGTIAESSVAGIYSKFGMPVTSRRNEIEQLFLTHPWLTGVHLHVGSQGCSISMLTEGIGILYDLVQDLNPRRLAQGFPPIRLFDIGGGLPVSYHPAADAPDMQAYIRQIRERAPGLFAEGPASFRLITEFGRWVFTNVGWTVSRVEYVKHDPGIRTAMIHVGADLFVRECLNPSAWSHEYSVLDPAGRLKTEIDPVPCNLAGPLCFSGDILAKNVMLPGISEGDYILVHDTGGYTFSMWSRYNSRQTPRILGYRRNNFEVLKEREDLTSLTGFWK